jgi:spermidine synthase
LGHGAGVALRALLAFAFLIVPVFLMGATLPLLAKHVGSNSSSRGLRIGALYSLNTFGAVIGCAATGFFFLPAYGYTRASLIGAAANVTIGVLAIILSRFNSTTTNEEEASVIEDATYPASESRGFQHAAVLVAFATSGFCALALEVIWTRLLTTVFIGTTYAFTTMLTTLLCGLAIGGAVASSFVDRIRRPALVFGVLQMLIGVACIWMLSQFAGLPQRLADLASGIGYRWPDLLHVKLRVSATMLFAPTFLFGMTFPFVVRTISANGARLGREIGRLYSANTFGGMFGSVAGGFLLIPLLGAHWSQLTLAFILLGTGALLTLISRGSGPTLKGASICAACVAAILGVYFAPEDVSLAMSKGYLPENHKLLSHREGVEGTVAVSEPAKNATASDRILWINAVQATASIEKGIKMNRFQGVLPLLFDRDPKTVLFMCFGSGITAGTLGLSDFERIDAVEISPDVLASAPLFSADNFNVLNNPKMRFIVDDGRNFLLTTKNKYDVITFEPMPLALAGVSTFYTTEFYRLCLERLAPGGVVSQWIPLHSLNPDVVRSLVRTFTEVFPEYCAWFVNADLFLIGSDKPILIDPQRARERLAKPEIKNAIESVGFKDLTEVLTSFFMGKHHLDLYVRGETPTLNIPGAHVGSMDVMSDDRPWAEFVAPILMYEQTVDKTLKEITPFFESPSEYLNTTGMSKDDSKALLASLNQRHAARAKNLEGLRFYYGGLIGSEPDKYFKQALEIDPADYNSCYYLKEVVIAQAQVFVKWNEIDRAIKSLSDALQYAPTIPELHLALADILFDNKQVEEARDHYREYTSLGGLEQRAKERAAAQ